jgi:PHP family Zn ribbon phosphoesterase
VVTVKVHSVLLAATQGGRALVAAGGGGEYRHLQTQRRADERLPQRLVPSIIDGRGPEGPEP